MVDQWDIARSTGVCNVSGRQLEQGEEHYTVLFEDGDSFRRADYSLDAWDGPPEGAYCFFKTRVPVTEKKKRLLVDDELLINFFVRLAEDPEPARQHFRFVLALILMRKRLIKYESTDRKGDGEVWLMRLLRDQSVHKVVNPRLNEEQIERVSVELGAILHGDMGDFTPAEESDGADADQEPAGEGAEESSADVSSTGPESSTDTGESTPEAAEAESDDSAEDIASATEEAGGAPSEESANESDNEEAEKNG